MNFSRGTALRKASANIHRDDDEKLNREHLETCKDQKCFAARKRKASDYHSDSELGMTIYLYSATCFKDEGVVCGPAAWKPGVGESGSWTVVSTKTADADAFNMKRLLSAQ